MGDRFSTLVMVAVSKRSCEALFSPIRPTNGESSCSQDGPVKEEKKPDVANPDHVASPVHEDSKLVVDTEAPRPFSKERTLGRSIPVASPNRLIALEEILSCPPSPTDTFSQARSGESRSVDVADTVRCLAVDALQPSPSNTN